MQGVHNINITLTLDCLHMNCFMLLRYLVGY